MLIVSLLFSSCGFGPNLSGGPQPLAPSKLTATAISSAQINLSWTDNSNNEDGFTIERRSGTDWTRIADVNKNVTTYNDSGLTASTTYIYRVYSYHVTLSGGGPFNYSNEAKASTY